MIALSFLLSICLLSGTGVEGQSSGDLRLVARNGRTSTSSPSLTAGRLEVYYNGEWGTVCDDQFRATAARIACNQLGFSAGYYDYETIGSTYTSFTASSSTQIWLRSLSCSFSDTRLIDCAPFGTIGSTTSCSHTEDVALYCLGNGALRLSSSFDTSAGRVEVYYNGVWGTVCNDGFGRTEANVACQQLGYGSSLTYGSVNSLGYSWGTGTIWLDNVDCTSSDFMLSSCSHNGFGSNNCGHSEDVAVSCSSIDFSSDSIFTTAVIVGIVIAVVVPLCCIGICVTIIVIAVCTGACAAGAASSRRGRRNVTTTTAVPSTTAAVVTSTGTSSQQTAAPAGFTPQAGYAPYPANLGKKEMQQYPGGGDPAYPPQGVPPYPTSGYTPVNP